MTPTFFNSPARVRELRTAALALVGTPFFANSEAPGPDGGIDCVHTLNWLYRVCGVIGRVDIPEQSTDFGQHSEVSLLIEAFETWTALTSRFVRLGDLSPEALLPGDALCFTAGKVPHHGGVLLDNGDLLHTLRGPGVHMMRLDAVIRGQKILGLLAAAYRPQPISL